MNSKLFTFLYSKSLLNKGQIFHQEFLKTFVVPLVTLFYSLSRMHYPKLQGASRYLKNVHSINFSFHVYFYWARKVPAVIPHFIVLQLPLAVILFYLGECRCQADYAVLLRLQKLK